MCAEFQLDIYNSFKFVKVRTTDCYAQEEDYAALS